MGCNLPLGQDITKWERFCIIVSENTHGTRVCLGDLVFCLTQCFCHIDLQLEILEGALKPHSLRHTSTETRRFLKRTQALCNEVREMQNCKEPWKVSVGSGNTHGNQVTTGNMH